jgi:hypothetical protein
LSATESTLAGRLKEFGGENRVVVTSDFQDLVEAAGLTGVRFHDPRRVKPEHFDYLTVSLLSIDGRFESSWLLSGETDDHDRLAEARAARNALELLLWSKRILEVNPADGEAREAIHKIAGGDIRPTKETFVDELIRDQLLSEQFLLAAPLVHRNKGELLCRYQDVGQTMFLILEGQLAGVVKPHSRFSVWGSGTCLLLAGR